MVSTIIIISLIIAELVFVLKRLDKIDKRLKRVDNHINTLQENDLVLSSLIKRVHQEFKTHEKKEKSDEKKRRISVG